eukprot:TRINITY_DN10729_c0_g1_i4.p1 TRINITY_DN10729_c0_g1~~TRINITY_DN10729_c0_g1_i4.p1  ORF type:complete len:211 (-),score=45.00 TRINITY_DN10729_c0_g1_i4:138-770(-)
MSARKQSAMKMNSRPASVGEYSRSMQNQMVRSYAETSSQKMLRPQRVSASFEYARQPVPFEEYAEIQEHSYQQPMRQPLQQRGYNPQYSGYPGQMEEESYQSGNMPYQRERFPPQQARPQQRESFMGGGRMQQQQQFGMRRPSQGGFSGMQRPRYMMTEGNDDMYGYQGPPQQGNYPGQYQQRGWDRPQRPQRQGQFYQGQQDWQQFNPR